MKMISNQEKIVNVSKKLTVILKLGMIVSSIVIMLALSAICILMFSGENMRSSFLAAFHVTANNGTTISIAPKSLLFMFVFMLIDTVLISFIVFYLHAIFHDIQKGYTPFLHQNTIELKNLQS